MLKKGQIIEGSIAYLDELLTGVLLVGREKVYVRHVLAKEKVSVRIVKKIEKGYAGELLKVVEPSQDRVKPACAIYERCGSCHLLHMSEEAQNRYKLGGLKRLCKEARGLKLKANEVAAMKQPYHYRNKMIIGFRCGKNRQIQAGFYEEFTHRIIPYQHCLLHPSVCDDIVMTITELMERFRIEPYDEDRRSGLLRHVLLRYGQSSGQIMVVLVISQAVFPARKQFVQTLLKKHPQITTIVQNVNTRRTSIVLGEQERLLYGKGYIEDDLCGLRFQISARSFYQINHDQTELLYQRAVRLLGLKGTERVLDAYCGIGTIGMYVSGFAKEVIGVEINRDAVRDAVYNAKANRISNIRFVCEDAGHFMDRAAKQKERIDVIIMDPPRSGSDARFIQSAVRVRPGKILYISCNPKTQVEDLRLFAELGYEGRELVGVDLFPQTFHVETVVLMSRIAK